MIEGVLLDLGGVVYVGDGPLPGALEALDRLRAAGLSLRYITNTTRTPKRAMLDKLRRLGVPAEAGDLFMPALAARHHLEARGLSPALLIHPALEEDFEGLPAKGRNAVVIGDAAQGFTYPALNAAFRAIEAGAEFLALARNRSFQDDDGSLSLDAGPFVAALEYASGRKATLFGKPSRAFFEAALGSLGCPAEAAVMVGDDVESDIAGAMAAGLAGLLVRTGKYRLGDEARITPPPSAVLADLSEAVDWILKRARRAG
jgi:HAD superfamily hydrolase (TIGR01458 family)